MICAEPSPDPAADRPPTLCEVFAATATDGAGAIVEVPTDDDGPRAGDARRWRTDSPGVEGDPVRGGTLGHSLP